MKPILLILLSITSFLAKAQKSCECPDTINYSIPIFIHLSDAADPVGSSKQYLKHFLNDHISYVNLKDEVSVSAEIFVGIDGKVCDIRLDSDVSVDTKQHIDSVLLELQPFKNTCFKFTKTININEYIKGGEEIYKVVQFMPIFNRCQRTDNIEESRICTVKSLEKYLFAHPLYKKLFGLKQQTYVLEFVITSEGMTTMVKPKKGNFEDKFPIFKQIIETMPPWQPGIHKDEKVNILYTIPVKVKL